MISCQRLPDGNEKRNGNHIGNDRVCHGSNRLGCYFKVDDLYRGADEQLLHIGIAEVQGAVAQGTRDRRKNQPGKFFADLSPPQAMIPQTNAIKNLKTSVNGALEAQPPTRSKMNEPIPAAAPP